MRTIVCTGISLALLAAWASPASAQMWNETYGYSRTAMLEPPAPPAPPAPAAAPAPAKAPAAAATVDAAQQPAAATEEKKEGDEKTEEEKDTCRWCHCGKLGEAWTVEQPCFLKEHKITWSGWLEGGLYVNDHGTSSNGPLGLEERAGFNFNQFWNYLERKTNTEECCNDWGGRIDYIFGTDGPDTQAFGDHSWDYGWYVNPNYYGSAIPQAYIDLAFGDWTIRGGRFYTSIGYEVVPATGNFFYSHAYAFYFAEPFTHTGFQVTRKVNDKLSVFGGWVDGWDSGFANLNQEGTFLGGVNLTFNEKTSLIWSLTAGDWGNGRAFPNGGNGTAGSIYMNSIVLTHKISDKWTYVFQHDLGSNENAGVAAQWFGINQYLLYKVTDCLSAGGRFEWFRDDDGTRIPGALGIGNPGNYYEATLGLNYKPHSNVTLRPEIRWDWYDGPVAAAGNLPFNDGQSSSQFSGGFDFLFTY